MNPVYRKPELLTADHDIESFCCHPHTSLNEWLHTRALRASQEGSAKTYVVCIEDTSTVVGFYCLSTGAIAHKDSTGASQVPGKVKRNMPDPIPVVVLGRLAVDQGHQGKGIGKGLVKDAIKRVLSLSQRIGIRAILVHCIDDDAKAFYEKLGFYQSPSDPLMVMVTLKEIEKASTEL